MKKKLKIKEFFEDHDLAVRTVLFCLLLVAGCIGVWYYGRGKESNFELYNGANKWRFTKGAKYALNGKPMDVLEILLLLLVMGVLLFIGIYMLRKYESSGSGFEKLGWIISIVAGASVLLLLMLLVI